MFFFGSSKTKALKVKFTKNKDVVFEDQPDKLCEVECLVSNHVVNMKSAGAWEAVNGNRFYFGK